MTPPLDLPAIRSRALADSGKPAGCCRWCGEPMGATSERLCGTLREHVCESPAPLEVVCADRFVLVGEVDGLRESLSAMHRRAQRLEGIEVRIVRIHAGYERMIAYLYRYGLTQRRGTRRLFREVYDALKAAGWPWGTPHPTAKIPGMDRPRSADAVELIGMLAAQRDAASAEVERLEKENASLRAVATGRLPHLYHGDCPDMVEGHDSRDPDCAACRALGSVAARAAGDADEMWRRK